MWTSSLALCQLYNERHCEALERRYFQTGFVDRWFVDKIIVSFLVLILNFFLRLFSCFWF